LVDPKRKLEELSQRLDDWSDRLPQALLNLARHRRSDLDRISARLTPALMARRQAEGARLERDALRLNQDSERLTAAMTRLLQDKARGLAQSGALLESYSYQQVLRRGFALVKDKDGHAVTSADAAKPGEKWQVHFADSAPVAVVVEGTAPKKPAPKSDKRQESLF
jgi:exodeoxyribonuclease VII large subunit